MDYKTKRSQRLIEKYGRQVTQRSKLVFPLKTGLYDNVVYDQMVQFSWLVVEYLVQCQREADNKKLQGKLFPYNDKRAFQIIYSCTGKWCHWFRVMSQRYYGSYVTKDYIRHSKFLNITNPMSAMPYLSYNPYEDLKNKEHVLPADWIQPAIEKIQSRITNQ
ncbi:hypothetical protein [Candidatus Bathycorpusculum sp.]|uniref:hypothetical protein n=1 Tax=Candidatus Bathycorpusculum sp. TaxID=2994959 RepID=UPI00282AD2A5|nr:hypothetical protein [Candidatus Termitimicrobium sp.]